MRITDIREMTFGINSDIRNSVIDFSEMTVSLVALISDQSLDGRPLIGYGFNSNGRYGQPGLLRERFFPRLRKASGDSLLTESGNVDPRAITDRLMVNEKPGGHGDRAVAIGIIDMAAWDLAAKIEGLPAHEALAARQGLHPQPDVWAYAAGGYYYPGKDIDQLQQEIGRYLELGYRTVKIKIGGAQLREDLARIEAVLQMLPPGGRLAVDANGRHGVDEALEYARALNAYDLAWYEEPVDPGDFAGHAAVAQVYEGPLATGENLFSWRDAENLLRYGGLRPDRDILQMDPVLSYGLSEYLRTIAVVEKHGWSRTSLIPHGGHQFNLHIAAALGLGGCEAYPGVFQPFGGFADGERVRDGRAQVPTAPGLGLELKPALAPLLEQVAEI